MPVTIETFRLLRCRKPLHPGIRGVFYFAERHTYAEPTQQFHIPMRLSEFYRRQLCCISIIVASCGATVVILFSSPRSRKQMTFSGTPMLAPNRRFLIQGILPDALLPFNRNSFRSIFHKKARFFLQINPAQNSRVLSYMEAIQAALFASLIARSIIFL